jgi:hypothetical protein
VGIFIGEAAEGDGIDRDSPAYKAHFKKMMAARGKKDLKGMTDPEKKSFFKAVDASWNSKQEKGKDGPTGK